MTTITLENHIELALPIGILFFWIYAWQHRLVLISRTTQEQFQQLVTAEEQKESLFISNIYLNPKYTLEDYNTQHCLPQLIAFTKQWIQLRGNLHPQIFQFLMKHNREPKQFNTSLANTETFTPTFLPKFSVHYTLAHLTRVLSILTTEKGRVPACRLTKCTMQRQRARKESAKAEQIESQKGGCW